jgi:hypothetical protein
MLKCLEIIDLAIGRLHLLVEASTKRRHFMAEEVELKLHYKWKHASIIQ